MRGERLPRTVLYLSLEEDPGHRVWVHGEGVGEGGGERTKHVGHVHAARTGAKGGRQRGIGNNLAC